MCSTDSSTTLLANNFEYSLDQIQTSRIQIRFKNIGLFQNNGTQTQVDEKGLEEWVYNSNHPSEKNVEIFHIFNNDLETPYKIKRAKQNLRFSSTMAWWIEISLEELNVLNNNQNSVKKNKR